ncbi:MAG: inositol monophosphatase family protein [Lewinellaceae bacterium]|nr:inositol monophosphatase family protein [Lewinellaceae bacterium]MCB9290299.1 inositol monophosphatase family protein [Lewinellaceae bacterium]
MNREILDFMKSTARQAGRIMMERIDGDYKVYTKPDHSRVTDVDLAISEKVQEAVGRHFPQVGLYSEESTNKTILPGRPYFIVDELDGTSHYIDNKTGFSHQAAYWEPGQGLLIGLIFYPWNDALLYAVKGQGAFLEQNGEARPLPLLPSKSFDELRYFHSARYHGEKYQKVFHKLGVDKGRVIRTDARRTLLMALGQLDVSLFLRPRINIWDLAGEKVILEELGFSHGYLDGSPVRFGNEPPRGNRGYLMCPSQWREKFLGELPALLPGEYKA